MSAPIRSQGLEGLFNTVEAVDVHNWIRESRQEDVTLDFKLARKALENRDERRVLAEAVSGFANSMGGLIIWGVDARKDPVTGADCAVNAEPLVEPERLLSNLTRLSGTAVSPILPAVVHRLVDSREFALTLVPESAAGPYMAKFGQDRYFKRSGDSFYRMEHYDLADMFGRRHRPKIEGHAAGAR